MPRVLTRGDLLGVRHVMLLTWTWGGKLHRLSTEPITISTDDGTVAYTGGMEWPDYREAMSLLESAPAEPSATITAYVGLDAADIEQQGHVLVGTEAELALVTTATVPGRRADSELSWANRVVLLDGKVTRPRVADPARAVGWVEFVLREPVWASTTRVLAATATITTTTWPSAMDEHLGKPYPYVIGAPGRSRNADGTNDDVEGSPAYPVEMTGSNVDTLLINDRQVFASTCTVFDNSGNSDTGTITHQTDGLGRQCAVIDISGLGAPFTLTDTEYWVAWTSGGASLDPWGRGAIAGIGSFARTLLLRTGLPLDHGRWAAVLARLNAPEVGTYITDAAAVAWDYLADQVLPLLPVTLVRGPQGARPIEHELAHPGTTQAVAAVTLGAAGTVGDLHRLTPWIADQEPETLLSTCTVRYAPKKGSTFRQQRTVTPLPDDDDDTQHATFYAVASRGTASETLDAPIIPDSVGALLIAAQRVKLLGFAPAEADVEGGIEWGRLQLGDVLDVTDAQSGRTNRAVTVAARWPLPEGWGFTLYDRPDPARDARAT